MSRYAEGTSVPIERTKSEIEILLVRHGADQFISGWNESGATIGFRLHNRLVRFTIQMPDRADFYQSEKGRRRSASAAQVAWEQSSRQRWRALLLVVRAKLEAVEAGVASFEEEFMAHIVLPNQQTISEWLSPQLDELYKSGKKLPKLLPGFVEKDE